MSTPEFQAIMKRLDKIEEKLRPSLSAFSKWMNEEEVIQVTGLSKRTLREKRTNGIFNFSTATGRKIKYLRKEIEAYINNNSTVRN